MFAQNNRRAKLAANPRKALQKRMCSNRIELCGRFVKKKQLRLHDHDRGKAQKLLFAAGKRIGRTVKPIGNAEI